MAVPVSTPITGDQVELAKERWILARATHLDSLVDKLTEPRVWVRSRVSRSSAAFRIFVTSCGSASR